MRVTPCAARSLPANLRQRSQPADLHLEQLVLLWLVRERVSEVGLERHAGSERRAQVHFVVAEQARAEPAVGGEPHAIARRAVRVCHRRDDADRSGGAGPLVVGGGPVPRRGSARRRSSGAIA